MTNPDLIKMNYETYKASHDEYVSTIKKILKSIPKPILISTLKELKIIKRNWEFKE